MVAFSVTFPQSKCFEPEGEIMCCQWSGCDKLAEKHVQFGLRAFGEFKPQIPLNVPFQVEHRKLCAGHVHDTQVLFHFVSTFEINKCPDNCQDR